MNKDRRAEERLPLDRDAAVLTRNAISYQATAKEISPGGIRITTSVSLNPGTQVAVFIQLDDELEIGGSVEWTLDILDRGLSIYHTGIQVTSFAYKGKKSHRIGERREMLEQLLPELKSKNAKRGISKT